MASAAAAAAMNAEDSASATPSATASVQTILQNHLALASNGSEKSASRCSNKSVSSSEDLKAGGASKADKSVNLLHKFTLVSFNASNLLVVMFDLSSDRFDNEQPSTSKCSKVVDTEPSNLFNTIAYSSFGKASICSSFSAKSGSSTTTEVVDLLKTISKDEDNYKRNNTNAMANLQESLNDVNSSIR